MNFSQSLLTSVRATQGKASDADIAELLGCTRQHIGLIKKGKSGLSGNMVIKAAKIAGIDPKIALLSLLEDRAESDEMLFLLKEIKEGINVTKH